MQAPLTDRCWTRAEYDRLVDLGMFAREPLELIGGHLIVAEPQGTYHAGSVGIAGAALTSALPPGWIVRIQLPLALDDESEPEPDVAVVTGTHADYLAEHPRHAALVIEVAESSLVFDRRHKGSLYARGRVPEYWIVNLVDRVLEVHREPEADPSAVFGWHYRSVGRFSTPAVVELLAIPNVRIPVATLLPALP
jgi:Uma2 family endonuclease